MSEVEFLKLRIKELEKEVEILKKNNSRNAGRKNKFKDHEIATMKIYKDIQGMTYREIASMFNCSVSTVHNLIS